jgi:hypothetical protein
MSVTLFDYQLQKFNRCAFFQKYHPLILQIIFIFNNPIGAEYGLYIYLKINIKLSLLEYAACTSLPKSRSTIHTAIGALMGG